MPQPPDASLLPTAELIDQLMTRFDGVVFCAVQDRKDAVGEGMNIVWRRKGDHHRCIGLAHHVIVRCQEDLDDITESIHPDDL